jgi:SAM-dependent methyltransferase
MVAIVGAADHFATYRNGEYRTGDDLYSDMYAGGRQKAWRDVGAQGKAANIARAWTKVQRPAPSVIEIGCGDGAIAEALSRCDFFASYRGFDISPSGIDQAEARHIRRAEFRVMARNKVPCEANAADVVVMSHVIEHLEHPRMLLSEARRLAPLLIAEVPLELNAGAPRDYVVDSLGHINKYNATSIRHLLQSCGYTVITEFTTLPSRSVTTFHDDSLRQRMKWRVKQAGLLLSAPLARTVFTYHETLFVARQS